MVYFVFVQAEDRIRDDLVTGVQTCALPISTWKPASTAAAPRNRPGQGSFGGAGRFLHSRRCKTSADEGHERPNPRRSSRRPAARSEERRVGKEGSAGCGRDLGRERREGPVT